jgi:phosphohistidine swiveling domain-containing protein
MTRTQKAERTHRPLTCHIHEAADESLVGGKARNLARLVALGMPVPGGLVLTSVAFDEFLDANDLRDRIDELCHSVDSADMAGLRERALSIGALVKNAVIPHDIRRLLDEIPSSLMRGTCLVARSSAVGEDSERASFAGQLDSVLGLQTTSDLTNAVLTCWLSYWSERALFYRTARAASLNGMAVIVQRQVAAKVSGVLFSRAPSNLTSAGTDDLMIEYCAGLGEGLVAGRLEPGRLIVSRADLAVRSVAEIPPSEATENIQEFLTPRRILDLARHALRLEKEFGAPQDIEWSIDADGELWLLQSRPITTTDVSPAARATAVWSNANVNENFPQPISPLLYSIAAPGYYHYFRNLGLAFGVSRWRLEAMEPPLRGIIGVHGGRMYYNLTNIHSILRMAPFGEQLAGAFNQFVGASEITATPKDSRGWRGARSHISATGELLRIAACTVWQFALIGRRVEEFERNGDVFAARTRPDCLQAQTLAELLDELRAFLVIRNHRWKNASLADAASMICYSLLQYRLKAAGYSQTLHNRLLRALPGVPSVIPPLRLWELSQMIRADEPLRTLFATGSAPHVLSTIRRDDRFAAFRRRFEQFLEEWGFRSSEELMLTIPSLQEDPIPAIELLKEYARGEGEPPDAIMARQAVERVAETSRLLRQLLRRSPAKAIIVWILLRWTQRAVAYRERARLKQALLYTRCRRIALAIGDRFVQRRILRRRDDIFMLSCQEIDELGTGRAMFPYSVHELVEMRHRDHAVLSAMQPTDTVRLFHGDYLPCAIDAAAKPLDDMHPIDARVPVLQGTGACGGRVDARAAVLGDVRQAGLLQRGEVLVTRQTDPGWAPVFCLISGLVIERGGMLSHGAIIAREFGLPCIVGVRGATRRIAHGAHVTVDGDLGTCTIHD